MDKAALQTYIHEHIPLTAAMQSQIDVLAADRVVISAPLEPNINHRETVFGGSASTLAILSAWTLLHSRLKDEGIEARVVIHKNSMSYDRPITDRFSAVCELSGQKDWQRFMAMLLRKGRGRIQLQATLQCHAEIVGQFTGDFVAIKL
jgi:thioesterase domain-containing protein